MASTAQVLARSGELDAVLEARAFAYGLLAQIFLTEPVPSLVPSLAESGALSLFPYAHLPGPIQEGVAAVSAYLAEPGSATADAYDRLRWDYTRLFIGPARLVAPPYESAYRTEERLLFQAETLAVRHAYLEFGLASAKIGAEPDDHIGLELQFMAETCRLAADRAAAGDMDGLEQVLQAQQRFLDEHLLEWAPTFAADVAAGAETGLFRGAGQMLLGYLPVDRQIMTELLQEM